MRDTPEPSSPARDAGPPRRPGIGRRLARNILPCLRTALVSGTLVLLAAAAIPTVIVGIALAVFRTVDPPGSSLIWTQRLSGIEVDQRWVPLGAMSPHLVRSVIASEDNQFCSHRGVDLRELEAVLDQVDLGGDDPSRGGSTITMQVAKNLFLWSSRSYVRKAIEIPLAYGIEALWPKSRIMEVYLNIAEWGPGVFGAEAAAQHHFRKSANRLTEKEAALLTVALPNPFVRVPSRPSAHVLKVGGVVERRARNLGQRATCVLG